MLSASEVRNLSQIYYAASVGRLLGGPLSGFPPHRPPPPPTQHTNQHPHHTGRLDITLAVTSQWDFASSTMWHCLLHTRLTCMGCGDAAAHCIADAVMPAVASWCSPEAPPLLCSPSILWAPRSLTSYTFLLPAVLPLVRVWGFLGEEWNLRGRRGRVEGAPPRRRD